MMHSHSVRGMALLFLIFIVNEDQPYVAAHNCGVGGGSGLGQFGRVYSEDFETSEDCEEQCGYVTGEAEAICKAAEGGACMGESVIASLSGGGACQAAGGACTATEAVYIALERQCEEYCDGKFPSKFDKIQENIDLTRKVLLNGQTEIKNNLEKLNENIASNYKVLLERQADIAESIANNSKELTEELILGQGRLLDNVVKEIEHSESNILNSLDQSKSEIINSFKQTTSEKQEEVLQHIKEFSNASLTLLTSIDKSLDVLLQDLQYNTLITLYGEVFAILDIMEKRYAHVQHDQETGLIVRDFESDQYTEAVTHPNLGMLIGIENIMNMLITGDGKNWAKSKSIYEGHPQDFCKQNWFSMFSLKLTRSLFHYRNGRRMLGIPVPESHSEKTYHEEHYEHFSKICKCRMEDLPTINDKTPQCNTTSSISNVGHVCQVECWGHDRDSVFCEGGEWTVDKFWLEGGYQGKWTCKAEPPLSYPVPDLKTSNGRCFAKVRNANILFSFIVGNKKDDLLIRKSELVKLKVIDLTCELDLNCRGNSNDFTLSNVSPLYMALLNLHIDKEIITLLLSAGANPNIVAVYTNKRGKIGRQSPLYQAAYYGLNSTVQELLDSGANIDYANIDKRGNTNTTALYAACYYNHPGTANILINAGANINIATMVNYRNSETTPLYLAVYEGMVSTVHLLMSKGARTDVDREPYTLLSAAKHSGDQSLINMFT